MGVCDPLNESILLQLAQRAGNSWQGLFDSGGQIRNIDRAVLAMFFNGHQHAFQHDEMTLGQLSSAILAPRLPSVLSRCR